MELSFFDWASLGTIAGAVTAVCVLTEITKNMPGIVKLPTQVWSYILAAVVLILSLVFGETGVTANGIVLALINAAVVSLAANGGYEALTRKTGED